MVNPQYKDILNGTNDTLKKLWSVRDRALGYEKTKGMEPRTSEKFMRAQSAIDDYFLPKTKKAVRNKPKKKIYSFDDDWI